MQIRKNNDNPISLSLIMPRPIGRDYCQIWISRLDSNPVDGSHWQKYDVAHKQGLFCPRLGKHGLFCLRLDGWHIPTMPIYENTTRWRNSKDFSPPMWLLRATVPTALSSLARRAVVTIRQVSNIAHGKSTGFNMVSCWRMLGMLCPRAGWHHIEVSATICMSLEKQTNARRTKKCASI